MGDYTPDEDGIRQIYEQAQQTIVPILNATAQETADLPLTQAVTILHARLNEATPSLYFNREQCERWLEQLRGGDDLHITLR